MRGLTLIELIVCTAILSIIFSVVTPSIVDVYDNHQSNSSVTQLRKVLTAARNIALNSSQKITICPNINGACNNNWQNPLSVFLDSNENKLLDEGETIFLTASNENNRGIWQARNGNITTIRFNERGHAFGSATTFLYCPTSKRNQYARQLIISFQGRIRSEKYLSSRGTPYASLNGFNCPP